MTRFTDLALWLLAAFILYGMYDSDAALRLLDVVQVQLRQLIS